MTLLLPEHGEPFPVSLAPGLVHYPAFLDATAQDDLLASIRDVIAAAPPFTPRMPRTAKPFSVRMTNCGSLGWVSDVKGYRYQSTHPITGQPWPPMPRQALRAWDKLSGDPHPPEACLVNFYDLRARMGLHQDRDEEDFDAPVVSLSLGATGVFRYGGTERRAPTHSVKLQSGDALVFGGPARLIYHGVDRVMPGSSGPLPHERINLTLRRVTKPD